MAQQRRELQDEADRLDAYYAEREARLKREQAEFVDKNTKLASDRAELTKAQEELVRVQQQLHAEEQEVRKKQIMTDEFLQNMQKVSTTST